METVGKLSPSDGEIVPVSFQGTRQRIFRSHWSETPFDSSISNISIIYLIRIMISAYRHRFRSGLSKALPLSIHLRGVKKWVQFCGIPKYKILNSKIFRLNLFCAH